jgi:hypothetical protein
VTEEVRSNGGCELRATPDSPDTIRHVWEVTEDHSHHQRNLPDVNWLGSRHYWNRYGERVAWALNQAGFVEVRGIPAAPAPPLTD